MPDDLTPAGAAAVRLSATVVQLKAERDRAREVAVALEQVVAAALARMDQLAADQRANMERAGTFETHMVTAINTYSDACDEIRAALEAPDA